MSHEITLTLPETLYHPLARMAQATHQPVETLLVNALTASLPSLDGLPVELVQELSQLEMLDNEALVHIMLETLPAERIAELDALLSQNQSRALLPIERERLGALQENVERLALRKARAAVLLRFRGQRIPTLTELRALTMTE